MDLLPTPSPGFAAFTATDPVSAKALARTVTSRLGGEVIRLDAQTALATWGIAGPTPGASWQRVLGSMARTADGPLSHDDVRLLLRHGSKAELLADVLPPFAAVGWDAAARSLSAITDWLGFRHLYVAREREWSGVSSSAAALAECVGRGLDETSVMVQSLLGWQTGDRSLFTGVHKLEAGSLVRLCGGRADETIVVSAAVRSEQGPEGPTERAAAAVVADVTGRFIDEHDDALLQLTGGLDSRILLGSIPPSRRSRVEALTLSVPGSPDLQIAADLAAENGMRHRVIDLSGLDQLSSDEAATLVAVSSARVEGSADPLALAALFWAERTLAGQPRLAGLGGEVARGFYYFGAPIGLPVIQPLSAALARWRMFPNDSVGRDALLPEFKEAALQAGVADVHAHLRAGHGSWWPATDEFYLWQRMQRWAGALASATAFDRSTLNPMLSRRFIDLARDLTPGRKRNMQYLSRICLEADASLADIELDGRPTPRTYAEHSWSNSWRLSRTQASKVVRKAAQRATHSSRPPAGGEIMASKVLEHWRSRPTELDALQSLGVFRPAWLDQVVEGAVDPTPSSVALMINLGQALKVATPQHGTRERREPASSGRVLGRSSARIAVRD